MESLGRRRRDRRNLVIWTCRRRGVPASVLADVFDLSRARVNEIVREVGTCHETGLLALLLGGTKRGTGGGPPGPNPGVPGA